MARNILRTTAKLNQLIEVIESKEGERDDDEFFKATIVVWNIDTHS